jgi:hypothetical protein
VRGGGGMRHVPPSGLLAAGGGSRERHKNIQIKYFIVVYPQKNRVGVIIVLFEMIGIYGGNPTWCSRTSNNTN